MDRRKTPPPIPLPQGAGEPRFSRHARAICLGFLPSPFVGEGQEEGVSSIYVNLHNTLHDH